MGLSGNWTEFETTDVSGKGAKPRCSNSAGLWVVDQSANISCLCTAHAHAAFLTQSPRTMAVAVHFLVAYLPIAQPTSSLAVQDLH